MLVEGVAQWNEPVTFDIFLADIPRMARLCFLVQALSDRRTNKRVPTGGQKHKVGRQVSGMVVVLVDFFLCESQTLGPVS